MNFYRCFIAVLVVLYIPVFGLDCSISLSPEESEPICLPSIVLKCSFCDLLYVRIEERAAEGDFVVLTSNILARNPDYEVVVEDKFYKLRIAQVKRYNGTRYRCQGFNATNARVFSDQWTLQIPSADVCASEVNSTVANTNLTTVLNINWTGNGTVVTENENGLEMDPELTLEWLSITAVPVVLAALVAVVCAVVTWCKCRRRKADACIQSAMQADQDVDMSSIQVTMGVKVDPASTHAVAQFSDLDQYPSSAPLEDNSECSIPNPRLFTSYDKAVYRDGNIIIPNNSREMESTAMDRSNTSMYPNPAYVALDRVCQGDSQATWQQSPISGAEFSEESDVHTQLNPAYEPLEALC